MEDKISLLVIPSQWPRNSQDIAGIFILDYVKSIQSHCKVSVLVLRMKGKQKGLKIEEMEGVTVYTYYLSTRSQKGLAKYGLYAKYFYKGWQIGRSISSIDLIHVHGAPLCGNLGLLIAKKNRTPVLISEHTNPFCKLLQKPVTRWLTRRAFRVAKRVLVVSRELKRQIETSGICAKNVIVTWNPVCTEMFNLRRKMIPKRITNIIYVGRLEEYKGGLRVVEAFSKILTDFPEWRLTIIGEGPERQSIEGFIQGTTGLSGKVMLRGQLAKSDVAEEMTNASFLVFPSRHETFGLVVAEAMAAGLPVIVGKGTAMDEFVDDSCGVLVDPDDVGEIAAAMKSMILNHQQYDRMKMRQQVIDRFGIDAFGRRLTEIYESVI